MADFYTTKVMSASKSKGGKKFWQASVTLDGDNAFTSTTSWHETSSGLSKPVTSALKQIYGKNIGKANETTPIDQAIREVEALAEKQKQKGYWPEDETRPANQLPLPMLAHKWKERSKHISFPCAVQPKLDGIRMLFNGVEGWSRLGNQFDSRITKHIECDTKGLVLDGELMLPAPYTFEETTSAVKAWDPERSPLLVYHVYDCVEPGLPFVVRDDRLSEVINEAPEGIRHVRHIRCDNADAIGQRHVDFTIQGYEGTMVRNLDGLYKLKDRSNDLQKYKDFEDGEFKIVGAKQGKGEYLGAVTWVCELPNGDTVDVTPRGSVPQKRDQWNRRDEFMGKMLTVRYQGFTEKGSLRFPVGIVVRDYE